MCCSFFFWPSYRKCRQESWSQDTSLTIGLAGHWLPYPSFLAEDLLGPMRYSDGKLSLMRQGYFSFRDVPPGTYSLEACCRNSHVKSVERSIVVGNQALLNIDL